MTVSNPAPDGNAVATWATANDEQRQAWLLQMEADYRAGIKPLRLIGAECGGVSHTFVNKQAKARNWSRDLQARVTARADALVSKAAVSTSDSVERAATEKVVVEANAQLQFNVRMAHRTDIARGRRLWDHLATELETTGLTREQIEAILALQGTELNARQRDAARQALSRLTAIGARIANFNTLVQALERLVKLERQAFGIEGGEPGDDPSTATGAAGALAAGHGRGLTDAERAIRLMRLLQANPTLMAGFVGAAVAPGGAAVAPDVPVPPDRA